LAFAPIGSELYGVLSVCAGHASSDPGSHLRRRLPASVEPGFMDGPKKRSRVFLHGPSILGRLPGFFFLDAAESGMSRARRRSAQSPALARAGERPKQSQLKVTKLQPQGVCKNASDDVT